MPAYSGGWHCHKAVPSSAYDHCQQHNEILKAYGYFGGCFFVLFVWFFCLFVRGFILGGGGKGRECSFSILSCFQLALSRNALCFQWLTVPWMIPHCSCLLLIPTLWAASTSHLLFSFLLTGITNPELGPQMSKNTPTFHSLHSGGGLPSAKARPCCSQHLSN